MKKKLSFPLSKKLLCLVFFILTLIFLITSSRLTYLGLHNIDLTMNYIALSTQIEEKYNISLNNIYQAGDNTNNGTLNYVELYSIGFRQVLKGFMALFLSMIFFGFSLYYLFSEEKSKTKKE